MAAAVRMSHRKVRVLEQAALSLRKALNQSNHRERLLSLMVFFSLTLSDSFTKLSDMTKTVQLQKIEDKIRRIKRELGAVGEMRPGSLSKQYNVCGKRGCRCKDPKRPQKHGPYYQLSWVHRAKSTSQFIRKDWLPATRRQLVNYKRFRTLTDQWVNLALRQAKLKIEIAKK